MIKRINFWVIFAFLVPLLVAIPIFTVFLSFFDTTGNYLDLSGTTMITMKEGKIAKEHDFFDMKSMLDQLQKASGEVSVDDYAPGTL